MSSAKSRKAQTQCKVAFEEFQRDGTDVKPLLLTIWKTIWETLWKMCEHFFSSASLSFSDAQS